MCVCVCVPGLAVRSTEHGKSTAWLLDEALSLVEALPVHAGMCFSATRSALSSPSHFCQPCMHAQIQSHVMYGQPRSNHAFLRCCLRASQGRPCTLNHQKYANQSQGREVAVPASVKCNMYSHMCSIVAHCYRFGDRCGSIISEVHLRTLLWGQQQSKLDEFNGPLNDLDHYAGETASTSIAKITDFGESFYVLARLSGARGLTFSWDTTSGSSFVMDPAHVEAEKCIIGWPKPPIIFLTYHSGWVKRTSCFI
eukprot:1161376-Pelagomonas_calceolata.AAC.1